MFRNVSVHCKTVPSTTSPQIIHYGLLATTFGDIVLGLWRAGHETKDAEKPFAVCHLHFISHQKEDDGQTIPKTSILALQKRWPNADYQRDDLLVSKIGAKLFPTHQNEKKEQSAAITIEVMLFGTEFQQSVWRTLTEQTQPGKLCTYSDVAELLNKPNAVRAVARAVAMNEVSILVPCHRVVAKSWAPNDKHKYRWGGDIKKLLIDYEAASKSGK